MFYYELYGKLAAALTWGVGIALVLFGAAILYSVRAYRKPKAPDGAVDEHAEPGMPVMLKIVYLALAIWIIAVTALVAVKGLPI